MKILFALLLLLGSLTVHAQVVPFVYKGGLISTRGPVPIGGDFVLSANHVQGTFSAVTSVDCTAIEAFIGTIDSRGRVRGTSTLYGYPIVGQFRTRNGYYTFTGRIAGGSFNYRVQASVGVFP